MTSSSFQDWLAAETAADRAYLLGAPAIVRCLRGDVTRELYVRFLTQAWHHVRHTVPLLAAAGERLPPRLAWLAPEIRHYVEDEAGHDDWILSDIAAAGGDRAAAAASEPAVATDAMVAYAWDTVTRRNPVGLFGMVFVLEGTSVSLALHAADRIQTTLGLPSRALTYLRSHGQLDLEHVQHLGGILARLTAAEDRHAVLRCARTIFRLYGDVFRGLDESEAAWPAIPAAGSGTTDANWRVA